MLFSALFLTYINLLAAQPTDVEKWLIKGNEYYDQKEYNKAIEAYTQVINIRLNEEKAAEERAKKQSANRDFYSFRRTWTGKEITAYLYRGKSYYKIKNYDAAIKDYLVVKKNYDPSYYQIYVSLGDAYGANGQYNEAYINYKKYVEQKPSSSSINFTVDKKNPADMWFCAVLLEKKELTDEEKYGRWLKEITDKFPVTMEEIKSFWKENRG